MGKENLSCYKKTHVDRETFSCSSISNAHINYIYKERVHYGLKRNYSYTADLIVLIFVYISSHDLQYLNKLSVGSNMRDHCYKMFINYDRLFYCASFLIKMLRLIIVYYGNVTLALRLTVLLLSGRAHGTRGP